MPRVTTKVRDMILDLYAKRQAAKEAEVEARAAGKILTRVFLDRGFDSLVLDLDGDQRIRATLVEPSDGLRWDPAKLDQAVEDGLIPPGVARACKTPTEGAPYVKLTPVKIRAVA